MVENIKSPQDIKEMELGELRELCGEIRNIIIDTVSENGGHLASNLGIVETTVAIHKVFDAPRDTLIFDVGHQAYAHKLLTGRYGDFSTLRKTGGISGFVNSSESEYDSFTEGHSGTSISQALGVAASKTLRGDPSFVIALVGDGSFTNGMIYEALNNCTAIGKNLIIILNDNEMSISKNTGGLSGHLTKIRTSRKYFNAKHNVKKFFMRIPWLGAHLVSGARRIRDYIKKALLSYNIFEALGADYIGVADGNDLAKMINVLGEAKTKDVCTVVHIHTKKGKGYAPAEQDPERFHSVPPFRKETGEIISRCDATFSSVFGGTLCDIAKDDPSVCAVTAAMEDGTGLREFKEKFPDRFFDVGIAEEHAITFSAGLASGGLRPVTALYSTFSQRTFDQVFHDLAVQGLPATICLDRAGIVEGDGVTHQGIFDVGLFSPIPGVNIYSPDSFAELDATLRSCVSSDTIDIIRYPKGCEADYDRSSFRDDGAISSVTLGGGDAEFAVVTYGRPSFAVYDAASRVSGEQGVSVLVVRMKKIHPVEDELYRALEGRRGVLFVEEGMRCGGTGERVGAALAASSPATAFRHLAIDGFVPHGSRRDLDGACGITSGNIASELSALISSATGGDAI